MKTYKVKLSFESKEYHVLAENETDAEFKAVQEFESRRSWMKADEVEVFDTPVIKVKYVNIDSWNRPIFKDIKRNVYYGSVNKLFAYADSESDVKEKIEVMDLCYFGMHFNCEPMGSAPAGTIEIIWSE